ncbi:hypothetical protein OAL25_00570 [bacterium]|nr:hypothetical protein [bacterium]
MTVKSADKKPEKYVGPDGKTKIRMVPMDKEVVKSEAYDEPQGQAKRMMSPLQKVRMDKEKADRDRDGKLKSTNKTLKALRKEQADLAEISKKTAQSYLDKTKDDDAFSGTRKANNRLKGAINAVGIKRKKESVESIEELTAAEKKLVNQMYDKKGNLTPLGKKVMDHGKKSSGIKEEVKQVDEISKGMVGRYLKKVPASAADAGDRTGTGGMGQVGASPDVKKGYEKQRKKGISQFLKRQKGTNMAVDKLTGKAKVPANEEAVNEVLDTPGAMDKYHNKAKAQSDRARNSATAKIVRGTKDISKEKDVIRKREKGMDMATNVRAKQFRKAVTGKPYGEAVEEDMNPYLKHSTDKLKNKHASFSRQIGDLQTKKLKGAKNPSIDQEIAKYQQKLRHVKNAMKNESIEEAEAPKKKKYLSYKDMKKAIASIKPPKKKPTLPKAPWDK